jgi:hypothetical protein
VQRARVQPASTNLCASLTRVLLCSCQERGGALPATSRVRRPSSGRHQGEGGGESSGVGGGGGGCGVSSVGDSMKPVRRRMQSRSARARSGGRERPEKEAREKDCAKERS